MVDKLIRKLNQCNPVTNRLWLLLLLNNVHWNVSRCILGRSCNRLYNIFLGFFFILDGFIECHRFGMPGFLFPKGTIMPFTVFPKVDHPTLTTLINPHKHLQVQY